MHKRRYRSGWSRAVQFKPTLLSAVEWAESNGIHLWSKQKEICELVEGNKQSAVKGGHQWGKTFVYAVLAVWWVMRWPRDEVGVVIVSPSWDQIKDGIMYEISLLKEKLHLPGDVSTSKQHAHWRINGRDLVVCRSPQKTITNQQTITGLHRRRLLALLEEGCGLDRNTCQNAESWVLNPTSKLGTIGNPLDGDTWFGDCFKPDSHYAQMSVPTTDNPAFTDEWAPDEVLDCLAGPEAVEGWRASMTNAEFAARVEARFPNATDLQIYSRSLINQCIALRAEIESNPPEAENEYPVVLGVDPSEETGKDNCRIWAYQRPLLRDVTPKSIASGASDEDIASEAAEIYDNLKASRCNVDGLGCGTDIGRMLAKWGKNSINILTGRPSVVDPLKYGNRRSELHFTFRVKAANGKIAFEPNQEFEEELTSCRQKLKPDMRFHCESKKEQSVRIGRSPGDLDASLLAVGGGDGTFSIGH